MRADEIATSVYRKIEAYYPLEGNVNEVLTNDFLRLDKGLLNFSEGHKGMALHCIGDSNYFAVPNVFADLISGNSLSLWFYVDSLPNRYQSLIDKTYRSDFTLKVTSDSMLTFRILSARNIEFETKTKVNVKEWYFVVVSVEDNVMSFYLNGQLIERSPLRNLKNNNYSAIVGAGGIPYAPGYQFYGKIDELCFFHAGLSLEEVDYLYKTGIELNTVFVRLHDLTDLPKELHDRWKNYPHLDVLIDSTLKTALLETKNNQLSTAELWRILNAKMDALGFKPPDNITKAQPTASFPKHLKEKREKQAKNLKYLYLVLGILILVIVFIFVFKGRLRRYVNGNKDYEGLTNELSLKEETLSQFAVQIVEKNKFIHQIGLDLKEIRKALPGKKTCLISLPWKLKSIKLRSGQKIKKSLIHRQKHTTRSLPT